MKIFTLMLLKQLICCYNSQYTTITNKWAINLYVIYKCLKKSCPTLWENFNDNTKYLKYINVNWNKLKLCEFKISKIYFLKYTVLTKPNLGNVITNRFPIEKPQLNCFDIRFSVNVISCNLTRVSDLIICCNNSSLLSDNFKPLDSFEAQNDIKNIKYQVLIKLYINIINAITSKWVNNIITNINIFTGITPNIKNR